MTDIRPRQPWALKMLAIAAHAAGRWLVWARASLDWDDTPTSPGHRSAFCQECLDSDLQVPANECDDHRLGNPRGRT